MKIVDFSKLLFSVAIVNAVLCSCQEEDLTSGNALACTDFETKSSIFNPFDKKNAFNSTFVDEKMVESFIRKNYPDEVIEQITPYVFKQDTVFYAVNLQSGWKIISADSRTESVLAYNDRGGNVSFDKEGCPAFLAWIDEWAGQIYDLRQSQQDEIIISGSSGQRSSFLLWKKVRNYGLPSYISSSYDIESIGPLMLTEWGQGYPWNYKCPVFDGGNRGYTGCVAVALAQIIYYHSITDGVPSGLYHNVDCTNVFWNGYYYSVNIIRSNYNDPSSRWSAMPATKFGSNTNFVGDLMMDIGANVNMEYYAYGSGSNITNACNSLAIYNLTGNTSDGNYNTARIKGNLQQGRPLYIRASAIISPGDTVGHAWVVDGYKKTRTVYEDYYCFLIAGPNDSGELYTTAELREMYPDETIEDGMTVTEPRIQDAAYLYMNWGWDGDYNGYFYEGPLDRWNVNNVTFSINKQLIYDIAPIEE